MLVCFSYITCSYIYQKIGERYVQSRVCVCLYVRIAVHKYNDFIACATFIDGEFRNGVPVVALYVVLMATAHLQRPGFLFAYPAPFFVYQPPRAHATWGPAGTQAFLQVWPDSVKSITCCRKPNPKKRSFSILWCFALLNLAMIGYAIWAYHFWAITLPSCFRPFLVDGKSRLQYCMHVV